MQSQTSSEKLIAKLLNKKLSGLELSVMLYIILEIIGQEKEMFHISFQKLASAIGYEKRSVIRAVEELKKRGFLQTGSDQNVTRVVTKMSLDQVVTKMSLPLENGYRLGDFGGSDQNVTSYNITAEKSPQKAPLDKVVTSNVYTSNKLHVTERKKSQTIVCDSERKKITATKVSPKTNQVSLLPPAEKKITPIPEKKYNLKYKTGEEYSIKKFTETEIQQEASQLCILFRELTGKRIVSARGWYNNYIYWRAEYSFDDILQSLEGFVKDPFWKKNDKYNGANLEVFFRRRTPGANSEEVDRIGRYI